MKGFYVETYGGGRYTSVAWYARREDAENEKNRRIMVGSWSGMPPRVTEG